MTMNNGVPEEKALEAMFNEEISTKERVLNWQI